MRGDTRHAKLRRAVGGGRLANMLRHTVAMLAVLAWATVSAAQIYEWRDADGARHFTTDVEDLPLEQRQNPRVVVRQSAWGSGEASPPLAVEPRREAQVVYDRPRRRSVATGAASGAPSVVINGPLAVASVQAEQSAPSVSYSSPLIFDEVPLVTTSFDRGRSRHQTLRMLLQDQFQADRDGPFIYDRVAAPGPRFRSLLPRGLPRRGARAGCVATR